MSDIDIKVKRLIYQSCNRGCKETDIMLGKFAQKYLEKLDSKQIEMYENICNIDDWDLYSIITGNIEVPLQYNNLVMKMIIDFNNGIDVNEYF